VAMNFLGETKDMMLFKTVNESCESRKERAAT